MANPKSETTIDTGDHVRHEPSGEDWVIGRVSGDRVYPLGWPPSSALLVDCKLIKKAVQNVSDPSSKTTTNAALAAILAKPDAVRTYPPPHPGGYWKATLVLALGHIDDPVRPYAYIGIGPTEQAAIDHLNALESADTWSAENAK